MEQMENKPESKFKRMAKKLGLALGLIMATERGAHAEMTVEQKAKMEQMMKEHPDLKKMFDAAAEVGQKENGEVTLASAEPTPKNMNEGQK